MISSSRGKHNLEMVQVMDERGIMTEQTGRPYAGMDRFACRKQILKDLDKSGYLVKNRAVQAPGWTLLSLP